MKSKELSLSKISKSITGVEAGVAPTEEYLMRIANSLEEVTNDFGTSVAEILSVPITAGDGEDTLVQKGSNAVAFGVNSTAFGTSSINAKERAEEFEVKLEDLSDEEILQLWATSDPADDKFALAKGEASHIEGNNCLALGKNSHAEGNGTIAYNNSSHAEGEATVASGEDSHAEGIKTFTQNEGEHAEGKYNVSNSDTIHSIGIGSDDNTRKNAFEILSNGLMFIYGVNGYDGTNIDTSSTGTSLQAGILNNTMTIDGSLFGWGE